MAYSSLWAWAMRYQGKLESLCREALVCTGFTEPRDEMIRAGKANSISLKICYFPFTRLAHSYNMSCGAVPSRACYHFGRAKECRPGRVRALIKCGWRQHLPKVSGQISTLKALAKLNCQHSACARCHFSLIHSWLAEKNFLIKSKRFGHQMTANRAIAKNKKRRDKKQKQKNKYRAERNTSSCRVLWQLLPMICRALVSRAS